MDTAGVPLRFQHDTWAQVERHQDEAGVYADDDRVAQTAWAQNYVVTLVFFSPKLCSVRQCVVHQTGVEHAPEHHGNY